MLTLNELHQKIEGKKILIFTNKNSFALYQDYFEKGLSADITYYRDFSLNPKLSQVKACMDQTKSEKFDVIMGIGGGSPMDFAKAIHYFRHFNLKSYDEYLAHLKAPKSIPTNSELYIIPTTSGSGSEGNCFSVIYDENEKYSLATPTIYPTNIVLDPKFTEFLPKRVTAYTGIDAITHALEAYWANDATEESRKISLQALEVIVPILRDVVHAPTMKLREKMAYGAFLAGKAIDTAKTTAPHAFSYYLTTRHGIPHGQAVAVNLGFFIEINASKADLSEVFKIFNAKSAKELREAWFELLKDIELYQHPLEIVDDQEAFFNAVNTERLGNNPYPLRREEFEGLFKG